MIDTDASNELVAGLRDQIAADRSLVVLLQTNIERDLKQIDKVLGIKRGPAK